MENHPSYRKSAVALARKERNQSQRLHHSHLIQKTTIIVLAITFALFSADVVGAQEAVAWNTINPAMQSVAQSINQTRANAGLPPLALHPLLNQAAQNHANDMIANNNYSHVGWDGSRVADRVQRTGYVTDGWTSENWVSVSDPNQALRWWMNSYVHRNNILNTNWSEFGIGSGRHNGTGQTIFVAVFSTGSDGSNQVVAAAVQQQQTTTAQSGPPSHSTANNTPYAIRQGDTLMTIAERFGLTWQVIASANGLGEHSILQVGQIIQLPGSHQLQSASATTTSQSQHVVQQGDTLMSIAIRYGKTWQQLASVNGLTERDLLQIGQTVVIPQTTSNAPQTTSNAPQTAPAIAAASTPIYYTVQAGDTIITIAAKNGQSWRTLLALNGLAENSTLQIGQQIRIR